MERHRATSAAVVKPLSFDPPRLLAALKRSGYALVSTEYPLSLLPFCEEHDLVICEPACYTVTLRPREGAKETPEEKAKRFEDVRQENLKRRLKLASKRKSKSS